MSARGASPHVSISHPPGVEDWTFPAPFSIMQLRLMPRRRFGRERAAVEATRLQGFRLVRPTRLFAAGMRVPLDLLSEIEAMVVIPA